MCRFQEACGLLIELESLIMGGKKVFDINICYLKPANYNRVPLKTQFFLNDDEDGDDYCYSNSQILF